MNYSFYLAAGKALVALSGDFGTYDFLPALGLATPTAKYGRAARELGWVCNPLCEALETALETNTVVLDKTNLQYESRPM